ncbi:hypothetical protein, partial [Streptomyces diastaticus]|uniref:hypothetical protein n=1 Tax=Streptomyces diastaticus TaxID=1956 RepID=UPI0036565845
PSRTAGESEPSLSTAWEKLKSHFALGLVVGSDYLAMAFAVAVATLESYAERLSRFHGFEMCIRDSRGVSRPGPVRVTQMSHRKATAQ